MPPARLGAVALWPPSQGRFYDERNTPNGPLPGGFFLRFTVNDPRTITRLVLNVTVTDTTASSFLTVWQDRAPLPVASDLNWVAGETVPNLTVVELSNQKQFDVYNFAVLADVVIDVDGFHTGIVQAVSAMVVGPAMRTNVDPTLARSAPLLAPKSSVKVSRHRA